jgi:hypothetical protein
MDVRFSTHVLSVKHKRNGDKPEIRSTNGKAAKLGVKQNVYYFTKVVYVTGPLQGVKVKQMSWESSRSCLDSPLLPLQYVCTGLKSLCWLN